MSRAAAGRAAVISEGRWDKILARAYSGAARGAHLRQTSANVLNFNSVYTLHVSHFSVVFLYMYLLWFAQIIMLYHCAVEHCEACFSSREAYRFHVNIKHDLDIHQVRRWVGTKFDNVDELFVPSAADLARRVQKWRRSRRLEGPRRRSEQRRRQRAAAAGAAVVSTSESCQMEQPGETAPIPSTSSSFHPSTLTLPCTTATATSSSLVPPSTSSASSTSLFRVRTAPPACRPAGYHTSPSPSISTVGSDEDASLFGDMSPERLHALDDFMAGGVAEEPRRAAEGVSAATQTDPAPQPVSPELLSTIQSHLYNLVIAQPTWLPSRIRRSTF